MRIDLNELSRRLGRTIPKTYAEFIESSPPGRYDGTLADPAEICAVNLAAEAIGSSGPATYGFVLLAQDGDYYLLREGHDSGSVHWWSHETREIVCADSDALALLNALGATQVPEVGADDLILSRVEPCTQSILDPIHSHELPAAVHGIPDVVAFEYSETVNPFTQEPVRFHTPGVKVTIEGREPLILRLSDGCLYCTDVQKPLPEQIHLIAKRLRTLIFPES